MVRTMTTMTAAAACRRRQKEAHGRKNMQIAIIGTRAALRLPMCIYACGVMEGNFSERILLFSFLPLAAERSQFARRMPARH
jgi:hypothetical protein